MTNKPTDEDNMQFFEWTATNSQLVDVEFISDASSFVDHTGFEMLLRCRFSAPTTTTTTTTTTSAGAMGEAVLVLNTYDPNNKPMVIDFDGKIFLETK